MFSDTLSFIHFLSYSKDTDKTVVFITVCFEKLNIGWKLKKKIEELFTRKKYQIEKNWSRKWTYSSADLKSISFV